MVSGKYSAVAGAVSREQAINNIAANLANVNTVGYKRSMVSFESLLRGEQQALEAKGINYARVSQNYTDFEPGPIRTTANTYDLSIHGEGFFKVQADGGPRYTRRGDFSIDDEGTLRTSNGLPVLDSGNRQITIPDTDIGKVVIDRDGTISIVTPPDGARQEVGQVGVFKVNDNNQLRREEDTTYSLLPGGREIEAEDFRVVQGTLELANVNMTEELTKMINNNRTFETYHKVLESYSTLGEKQDELGTLS